MKAGRLCVVVFLLFPAVAWCGGAWLPAPGQVDLQIGYSRKTASSSWDSGGTSFPNTTTVEGHRVPHYHDFRYGYLAGEVGVHQRVSATFLVTYLHGLEGPHSELEKNTGMSDAWLGLKYAVARGNWPMAVAATMRTPALYDRPGAYNRYVLDSAGNRIDVSSEWRGVLKRDYTLSYLVSHSFREGQGWMTIESGYTWREGAPADQVPFNAEVGWPLPWRGLAVKASMNAVHSLGNDSAPRPDDRFRPRADGSFNFNDASMLKAGLSVIVPLRDRVDVEVGYSQWLRGESARRYREPFASVGYRF